MSGPSRFCGDNSQRSIGSCVNWYCILYQFVQKFQRIHDTQRCRLMHLHFLNTICSTLPGIGVEISLQHCISGNNQTENSMLSGKVSFQSYMGKLPKGRGRQNCPLILFS